MRGSTAITTRRAVATGACVILAGAYSWWVATTKPFTTQADIAVIVGFVMIAVVLGARLWQRRRFGDVPQKPRGRIWTWAVTIALLAVVELSGYFAGFGGGRDTYPTLSSLYDGASRVVAVKALLVFVWLAMGWALFRPLAGGADPRR